MKLSRFDISPAMRIQMLKVLDLKGKDFLHQPHELKYLLAPIIAKNVDGQEQFYELFDKYMEEMQKELPQTPKPPVWYQRIPNWVYGLLVLFLVGFIIYGLSKLFQKTPLPKVHFESITETRIGDTLTIINQSLNLGPKTPMVWSMHNQDGSVLHSDTISRDDNWTLPIKQAGAKPQKTVRLSLVDPIKDSLYFYEAPLVINCTQAPLVEKGTWPDSTQMGQSVTFQLKVNDDRPYTYNWKVDEGEQNTNTDSLSFTFEKQGFHTLSVKIELPDEEGRCIQTLEHNIRVIDQQEIAPLVEKPLSKIPDTSKAYFKSNWWLLLSLLGLLPLWFLYKWWKHRQKQKGQQQPLEELRQVFDAPDKPPYFIPFRSMKHVIHPGKELYDFANTLRQRQEGLRKELNVEKSLKATIEKGGFPDIKMERSTQPSEYLFLIDDQHRDSIQSRLFEYLVDFLKDKDVYAERYFYKDEPYSIWKQKESEALNLQQLQGIYPYHRFVLMGDAHRFLSQSGNNAEALKREYTSWLERWKHRSLLTPTPPCSWTYKESGLHRWLPTFPADMEGIEQAFDALQDDTDEESNQQAFNGWQKTQSQLRPSDPDVNYRKWRKLEVIKDYLIQHPRLWQWLSALSVHSAISWELTLAIGHALDTDGDLVTFDHLLLLSRIPWLQQGHFPPRLRLQLLEELDDKTEGIARQTVKTELKAVESLTKNSFVNFELQSGLAVQNFLLDPENKDYQKAIRSLTAEDKPAIGKHRFKELDQQIKKYQLGKGQNADGLSAFLDQATVTDLQGEEALDLPNPFTKWLAVACSIWLLSWLLSFGLNGKDTLHKMIFGDPTAVQEKKQKQKNETLFVAKRFLPPNEIAELNNKAVDLNEERSTKELTTRRLLTVQDSIERLLDKAYRRDSMVQIVNDNRTHHQYNLGIFRYRLYFQNRDTSQLDRAFDLFKNTNQLAKDFPDALHGMGLCNWYRKDRLEAVALYNQIDYYFFDTLSPPMDETNLRTLLQIGKETIIEEPTGTEGWKGRVLDSRTQEPLYPVLVTGKGGVRVRTNIDGYYRIRFKNKTSAPPKLSLNYNLEDYTSASRLMVFDANTDLPDILLELKKPVITSNFEVDISDECCEAPCTKTFTNKCVGAVRYEWTFGDGNSSTDKSPEHTYTKGGTYEATLKAFADDTTSATKSVTIEVCEKGTPPKVGTFNDSRDGQSYTWKRMKDGKKWMTENLNYKIADSYCQNNKESNCKNYGRLYTWAAAKKACPSGWYLPSDKEWQTLAIAYGGYYDDKTNKSEGDPGSSYQALISGGSSNFAALFGGFRGTDGSYNYLGNYGYYWSSSENDPSKAWFYNFHEPYSRLRRYHNSKTIGFSCRCINGDSPPEVKDRDQDGIPDKEDHCPNEKGEAENNGCPVVASNNFIDPRDNQTYKTITIGTQTWMAQNLNYKTTDSWCYLELPEFCDKLGRLYTWEAAKKACPKGWHLPSNDEWKILIDKYGGEGEEAYSQLIDGGETGFAALLGGIRDSNGEYIYLSSYGYYWSARKVSVGIAWFYYFDKGSGEVSRDNNGKANALSCRCLKD